MGRGFDDVVEMRGSEGVAAEGFQELADGAVVGDRVEFRLHALEPVAAIRPGAEHAAQVEIGLDALLLDVVEAFVIGLPDVDLRIRKRRAVGGPDRTADQHRLALLVEADIGAHGEFGGVGDVEGAEDGGFGGAGGFAVVDRVHQHRDAGHVGEKDELLPPVGAHVAGGGQELDRLEPLGLGRLDFLDGGVEVAGEDGHDLGEALVLRLGVAGDDDLGGGGFGEEPLFGHVSAPGLRGGCG